MSPPPPFAVLPEYPPPFAMLPEPPAPFAPQDTIPGPFGTTFRILPVVPAVSPEGRWIERRHDAARELQRGAVELARTRDGGR
jgi:hypothetical protein